MDVPEDNEPPLKIKVEGAGTCAVNGEYERDGFYNDFYKYRMQGVYQSEPCVFSNYHFFSDGYIGIMGPDVEGFNTDKDFYECARSDEHHFPPSTEWETFRLGEEAAPRLFYFASSIVKRASDPCWGVPRSQMNRCRTE
jgi:hypothetical protein